MVSKLAFLSNLFLAFVALAVPPSQLGTPRGEDIQSHPSDPPPVSVSSEPIGRYFNPNWAGDQCAAASFSEKFSYISGTFIVPAMDPGQQLKGFSGCRIAVVLGNIGCSSVFLSGVRITFSEHGEASYEAMYGTYLNDFRDMPRAGGIMPGDQIKLTAYVSDEIGKGIVMVENISPSYGREVWGTRVEVDAPQWNRSCDSAAQWIVQAYKDKGAYVPLADFRKVIFTDDASTLCGTVMKYFSRRLGSRELPSLSPGSLAAGNDGMMVAFRGKTSKL